MKRRKKLRKEATKDEFLPSGEPNPYYGYKEKLDPLSPKYKEKRHLRKLRKEATKDEFLPDGSPNQYYKYKEKKDPLSPKYKEKKQKPGTGIHPNNK